MEWGHPSSKDSNTAYTFASGGKDTFGSLVCMFNTEHTWKQGHCPQDMVNTFREWN